MSEKPVLVIMAAGMGSRYGGCKQMDPVDPFGNLIIDFSLYDAKEAGFEKVIFLIKHAIESDFQERIGNRISQFLEVEYAYQELDALPEGFAVPEGREKPWGTAHAILCCKDKIHGPFAVINADDYYGKRAFRLLYEHLSKMKDGERFEYAMVGYELSNTLTENGSVARGVCEITDNHLTNITERTCIEKHGDQARFSEDQGATWTDLPKDTTVSMNMWGFTESILTEIEAGFGTFLQENLAKNPKKCEYFLPSVVDSLLKADRAEVTVLKSPDRWYGMTYKKDKETVVLAMQTMKDQGLYPQTLWVSPLEEAKKAFATKGQAVSCERYGSGHINDTYRLRCEGEEYILQRMNTKVFTDPVSLMKNVQGVTSFLREKILKNGGDPERETLNLVPTTGGEPFFVDSAGGYWRMYRFIEHATCYNLVEKPEDFYQSGRAFGRFQGLLAGYPAEELVETIPDFHNTPKRYETFLKAVEEDVCGRAGEVAAEIAFVKERAEQMGEAMRMLKAGELPLRVTHNDTKLNNVMIDDATGQAICVIDLDTVMPGLSIFDFGDSIRFGANTALEDEQDLDQVSLSLELFSIYVKGFLEGCGNRLTQTEVQKMPLGAWTMTMECGMRFLTDYLQGDTYFHVAREKHNLDRCRTQFCLVSDMERKWDAMEEIVNQIAQ